MWRVLLLAALGAAGCKDKPAPPGSTPSPPPGDTPSADPHVGVTRDAADSGPPIDWPACEAAVTKAANAPLAARVAILLDGCKVCGDWTPILRWNTPSEGGGPKRNDIEHAMLACNAFCIGDAKLKFLGTLDDARGKASRMPWKQLAQLCGPQVSAVPDDRFVGGTYFALDRIARTVGAKGGDVATKLAELVVPLPAVSVVGTGPGLPRHAAALAVVSAFQITVLGNSITVGPMPRARLTADGVVVDLGTAPYPGQVVTLAELETTFRKLAGNYGKADTVALIAPAGAPAANLVPVIAAATRVMPVRVAVRANESPEDWDLPGELVNPLRPTAKNTIRVTKDMTVQGLADAVAKQADVVGIAGP